MKSLFLLALFSLLVQPLLAENTFIRILPKEVYVDETFTAALRGFDTGQSIKEYIWNFGDGKIKISKTYYIKHSYRRSGKYDLRVELRFENPLEDEQPIVFSKKVQVLKKNKAPQAKFKFSKERPFVGEEVVFTSLSKDRDGKIKKRKWSFGRERTEIGKKKNLKFKFMTPGPKVIGLSVEDNDGAINYVEKNIYVKANDLAPHVRFSVNKKRVRAGEEVTFKAKYKTRDSSSIRSIMWDFGDGVTKLWLKSASTISHTYKSPGKYKASLSIETSKGKRTTKFKTVTVLKEKKRLVTVDPAIIGVVAPHQIDLAKTSTGAMKYTVSAFDLDLAGVDGNGTITWVESLPGVISIQSLNAENRDVEITANSTGTTELRAQIGNTQSAPITIEVFEVSSGGFEVVLQEGDFISKHDHKLLAAISPLSGQSFAVSSPMGEGSLIVDHFSDEDSSLDAFRVQLAPGVNTVPFEAQVIGGTEVRTTAKDIRFFDGRGGSLKMTDSSQVATLELQDNRIFSLNESFSLSFWIKPENGTVLDQPILSGEGAFDWGFYLNDSLDLSSFRFFDRGSSETRVLLGGRSGNITENEWRHIALTFDKDTSQVVFYQNGKKRGELTLPSIPATAGSASIQIKNFVGSIDEVRLWKKNLSEADWETELFSPALEDHLEALSFFSFDGVRDQKITSDNDSSSYILLGEHIGEDAKDPQFGFASTEIASFTASQSAGGSIFAKNEELMQFDLSGDLAVKIPSSAFEDDKTVTIKVEVADSEDSSYGYEEAYAEAMSPIYRVHASDGELSPFSEYGTYSLRLPFYTDDLTEDDIKNLRVFSTNFGHSQDDMSVAGEHRKVREVKPVQVNLRYGEVLVSAREFGSFWVSLVPGPTKVNYTSPEFAHHPNNERDSNGKRKFHASIDNTESPTPPTVDVPLTTTGSFDVLNFFSCDTMPTQYTIPSVITGFTLSSSITRFCHASFVNYNLTHKVQFNYEDQLGFIIY